MKRAYESPFLKHGEKVVYAHKKLSCFDETKNMKNIIDNSLPKTTKDGIHGSINSCLFLLLKCSSTGT